MNHDVQQEIELRRYLLGELPLEEQVQVQQRLFLDSEYAEILEAVEDDLIDDYLADELNNNEREKFVNHFLELPEHKADFRIAEALQKHAKAKPAPILPFSFRNKSFVWLSLAVAALIVFSIIAWTVFRATRGPAADAPLQARDPQPKNTQPDQRQPTPPPNNENRTASNNVNGSVNPENSNKTPERRQTPVYGTVFKSLVGGGPPRSGGSINKLTIYADTKEVTFTLALEFGESYENYRAELLRGQRKIDERTDLKSQPDDKSVSVTFPANLFREQSYGIKLHAVASPQQAGEPSVLYSFQVEKSKDVAPIQDRPLIR